MAKIYNHAFRGAVFAITAYACYATMNAIVKLAIIFNHINSQIIYFYANLLSTILLFIIIFLNSKLSFQVKNPRGLIARIVAGIITLNLTFVVIAYIPLELYYSITFMTPIIVSLLAVFFLKDSLNVLKLCMIGGGFIGILVIFTPWNHLKFNSLLTLPILGALVATISNSFVWIFTKKYLNNENIITILFYLCLGSTIFSGLFLLVRHQLVIVHNFSSFTYIILTSGFTLGGYYFYTKALQTTKISFIIPAEYTLIVFGSTAEIVIFKHYPAINTIIGSVIIVLTSAIMLIYNKNLNPRH